MKTILYEMLGAVYFAQVMLANFPIHEIRKPAGLEKIVADDKTKDKVKQLEEKNKEYGKDVWRKFWACDGFNIDYSNPENYKIDQYGKCSIAEYNHHDR